MKKLKFSTKMYLLAGALALVSSFIICTVLVLIFTKPSPPTNSPPAVKNPEDDEEELTPSLSVPSSITIELLDTATIIYSVENLGEYNLSVEIQDESIARISNGTIVPSKIGTTKIIFTINSSPAIVKETIINVVDCTKEVQFIITNENYTIPEIFYTNTYYILEIKHNLLPSEYPTINYDNINEFSLLKTQDNSYYFKFKIKNSGSFIIDYVGKYVNLNKTYFAHKLPGDFKVNFTNVNVLNNKINLSLFNKDHTAEANADNVFNTSVYEIITENNTIDNVILKDTYDKNIISIDNNQIAALNEGSTTIEFYSTISGLSSYYEFTVSKVELSGISINGELKSIGSSENIELKSDELYSFLCVATPIYALGDLMVCYDSAEIILENNSLKLAPNITTSTLTIKFDESVIYTLTLTTKVKPTISHTLKIIQTSNSATLTNNTINSTYIDSFYITLNVNAIDSDSLTSLPNQNFAIKSISSNICELVDVKITNGNFTLHILSAGICVVTITDLYYNINIEITLVIT